MTTTTARVPRRARPTRPAWLLPSGLLLLCVVPVAAGMARLAQLARGVAVTPDNERFLTSPLPVVVHVIGASLFLVLGAAQFVPTLRRRHLRLHRTLGRLLVPAGLAAALSGLWMSFFYALPPTDNSLLQGFRLVFGTAMIASLLLGVRAAARHDIPRHRVWMARAYAIGLGAGTQVITSPAWLFLHGPSAATSKAFAMLAGWAINLVVAECALRGIEPQLRSAWNST